MPSSGFRLSPEKQTQKNKIMAPEIVNDNDDGDNDDGDGTKREIN